MDAKTERLLNLYLDGLLPDRDRLEFEEMTRRDPALRHAVQVHRQAAREMARMPDLPPGFTAAARARLERERPPSVPAGWFHRFWSLEAAGLAAAAILVAAVLYPVLQNREPEGPPATTLEAKEADEGADQEVLSRLRSLGYIDSTEKKPNLPGVRSESIGGVAGGKAAPSNDRDQFARKIEAEGREAAGPAGPDAGATTHPLWKSLAVPARNEVSFRSIPYPGPVDMKGSEFLVLKTESDLQDRNSLLYGVLADSPAASPADRENSALTPKSIDFSREMAILLPNWKSADSQVRIEVLELVETGTTLLVLYRENRIDPSKKGKISGPAYQLIILPASDLEIRLKQEEVK